MLLNNTLQQPYASFIQNESLKMIAIQGFQDANNLISVYVFNVRDSFSSRFIYGQKDGVICIVQNKINYTMYNERDYFDIKYEINGNTMDGYLQFSLSDAEGNAIIGDMPIRIKII